MSFPGSGAAAKLKLLMHECLTLKLMSKEFMPIFKDELVARFLSKNDQNKLNNTQQILHTCTYIHVYCIERSIYSRQPKADVNLKYPMDII